VVTTKVSYGGSVGQLWW